MTTTTPAVARATITFDSVPTTATPRVELPVAVQTIDLPDIFNAATVLFALQNQLQGSQENEQEAAIRAQVNQIKLAMDQVRQAAEQARENAEKSSFWSDVASTAKLVAGVATIVAGVAASIATGGLSAMGALAIAGALLSVSSKPLADGFFGGNDTADLAIGLVGAGTSLVGGVGSLGAGAAETTASTSSALATGSRTAGTAVAAGATVVQGGATIASGKAQGESVDAEADGVAARAHKRVSQEQLDDLISALKELGNSFHRAKESLLDSQNIVANSNNMLLATLGK